LPTNSIGGETSNSEITNTTTTTLPSSNPTILFDINYSNEMNPLEAKSLSRQLTTCYASNRRSPHPFSLVFSGKELNDKTSCLVSSLEKQNWKNWNFCKTIFSQNPWKEIPYIQTKCIYLTADSPNILTEISNNCTYIIGGLVDHKDKPFFSYNRALEFGLETAKLPLESALKIYDRGNRGGLDVTTLSVVQTLLSIREYKDEGLATCIFKTPSFHCAPLRKYIKWIGEYEYLNEVGGKNSGKPAKPGKGFSLVPGAVSVGKEYVTVVRGDEASLKKKKADDFFELEKEVENKIAKLSSSGGGGVEG